MTDQNDGLHAAADSKQM